MNEAEKPTGFEARRAASEEARANILDLVRAGRWRDAETEPIRARAYAVRQARQNRPPGAESIIGATEDFQASSFLTQGARVRRSVGYVEVSEPTRASSGTGFLVSPRLFLTNQHVIRDEAAARCALITFDREMDERGAPRAPTTYRLAPDEFALFSDQEDLDFALVALGQRLSGDALPEDLGCLLLSNTPDRHVLGMNVNIIHHPLGLPKMVTLRNNILTFRTEHTLLYETDTDHGSSGAPVFNDSWDLVALHHWGEPHAANQAGVTVPTRDVNEGLRISAIFQRLEERMPTLPDAQQLMLRAALVPSAPPSGGPTRPALGPPRPDAGGEVAALSPPSPQPEGCPSMFNDQELRLIVPLEITVRLGATSTPCQSVPRPAPGQPERRLVHAAEKIQLDTDYANRTGYNPDFIPGANIPLPELSEGLAKQVAALRAGEPDAESGELKYEHFSTKMHKTRRLAIFTATNIDGETYLTVDRKTGLVGGGSEGDTWFKDPRISETFYTGQDFYSAWSLYFDRGHLTRRTDPTWGDDATAERANADTFHWTNCSPQHFRFNQTTPYWQGAERYVLENGLLSVDSRRRVTVFQGPVFDSKVDRYADDLQIPSSFFKVIVWKANAGLKAVALIVDQLSLLSEERKNLGEPHDVPAVNVSQWRVSVSDVEKRTGLSFGEAVRNADTFATPGQPVPGEERAIPLTSLAGLLPGAASPQPAP